MRGLPDLEPTEFFHTLASNLKVGTTVPFDCFIRIDINGKIVHWQRQGFVFSAERQEKLTQLEVSHVWIMNIHKGEFKKYMGVGHVEEKSDMVIATGKVSVREGIYPVFGRVSLRNQEQTQTGSVKMEQKASPPGAVPAKSKVDAQFINVIIASIQQVFSERFLISVTSKPPTRRTGAEGNLQIDIASFVGLTSPTIRGTVGLCFPAATYLYLLKQVTGLDFSEPSPENSVGCAEIMNSIFEIAQSQLSAVGYAIDQAIPTFVVGTRLPVSKIIPDRGFSIVFEAPGGPFQFEIGVKTGA